MRIRALIDVKLDSVRGEGKYATVVATDAFTAVRFGRVSAADITEAFLPVMLKLVVALPDKSAATVVIPARFLPKVQGDKRGKFPDVRWGLIDVEVQRVEAIVMSIEDKTVAKFFHRLIGVLNDGVESV